MHRPYFGQIDLDVWSKSCAKLKLSRRFLQGDMAVTRTKNDLSPSLPANTHSSFFRAEIFF
jgi:hypothetical protein